MTEKAPQPARNQAVFIKGKSLEGVFLPSILAAAMGEEGKGQVGDVRVFRQPPFFLCLLSELMKTTRFLAGPPLFFENARRRDQGYAVGGRALGIMLLRDKNSRIVLYGSAPTTVARCLAFLEYTRQL